MFETQEQNGEIQVRILSDYSDEVLFRSLELELMVSQMNEDKVRDQIEFAKAHKAKYGDFFCRNEDGDVLSDGFGNPIPIRLPNSGPDLLARTNTYKLLISLRNEIETRSLKNREGDSLVPSLPAKKDFKYLLEPRKKDEQS